MKRFKVVKAGLFTTVQDLGRYGYLKYGVPISGAMDQFSLVAANLLVGNEPDDACLETTSIGPELQVLTKTQTAITGGKCSPKINGADVPMWETLTAQEGDIISIGKTESGCRTYVSMREGIDIPQVLGSRSTYVRGRFGGIEGRQLKTGDIIHGFDNTPLGLVYSVPEELIPQFTNHFTVHVILGPQVDMFPDKATDTFLSNPYKIALEADRMGYRLEGQPIQHKGEANIISDALLPGTIQVPKDGKPIVIMRDAQTTGGYPKIAVVISSDISMLGQAKPNDTVEFSKVTLKEAHRRRQECDELFKNLNSRLVRKQ